MQLVFYLPTFSTPCMSHLLYLMFRCDGDVMKNLDFGVVFEGSKHTLSDLSDSISMHLKFLVLANNFVLLQL